MSIFGTILNKLGFGHSDPAPAKAAAAPHATTPVTTVAPTPVVNAAATPTPMSEVDVLSKLNGLADASDQKLNWRQSIVDLMKLLQQS
jgi:hypothetical protein